MCETWATAHGSVASRSIHTPGRCCWHWLGTATEPRPEYRETPAPEAESVPVATCPKWAAYLWAVGLGLTPTP